MRQLGAVLAAQRARRVEVAAREVARERLEPRAERAEADDQQPRARLAREHERPGGQQQLDALGGDQLADEDDQPVVRARSWPSAAAASPGERANDESSSAVVLERRRAAAEALEPGARLVRLARREPLDVDAGRPEAGAVRRPGVVHRGPQALRGVARADEDAAGARQPLARVGHEARVRLDRVLERAAVDLHRVGHAVPSSARARITGPITRWLASATSGRARSATSRTAATLAST